MAKGKKRASKRGAPAAGRPRHTRRRNAAGGRASTDRAAPDAVALLKADHREVEGWFEEFEKSRSGRKRLELAQKICTALKVHTTIEEEIFYPAFLEATGDKDMHHEAEVEHDGAKKLIGEIESSSPDDDYYAAKMKVLAEMIKHHVKEEEQRAGMFAEARQSNMDLRALGQQMKARKDQLKGAAVSGRMPRRPDRHSYLNA